MAKQWNRRNIFINKELQGKYIFTFFLFVIAGSMLFIAILSFFSANTLTMVYDNYKLQIGKTPLMLMKELLRAHWTFVVVGGLVVIVSSMLLTHHFVGPLYRFQKSVKEMVNGNLDFSISLRENDAGKELAEMINQFNYELSSRIREMKQLSEKIDRDLSGASGLLHEGPKEAAILLKQVVDSNRRLREILEGYRLRKLQG